MQKSSLKLILIFVVASTFMACEDNNNLADVNFEMKLQDSQGNNINLNETFNLSTGEAIQFTKVEFYISNLSFNAEPILDSIYLFQVGGNTLETQVNKGNYNSITFGLGVNEDWNNLDPATFPNKHPLGLNFSNNHWSWNSGYIFYKLEGTADLNNDGDFEQVFLYHIGSNSFYRDVAISKEIKISNDAPNNIEIYLDAEKIFRSTFNIDLINENQSHSSGDGYNIAEKIVENVSSAINVKN